MFFYLGQKPTYRFPCFLRLGNNRILEFDMGWVVRVEPDQLFLYKGYIVPGINHGNGLSFKYNKNTTELTLDWGTERTTPIYYCLESQELENLKRHSGWKVLDYNERVVFDQTGTMRIQRDDDTLWGCDQPRVCTEEVLHLIEQRLDQKFDYLKKTFRDKKKFLFLSGGLDTALQMSFLIKHQIETEVVFNEQFESCSFIEKQKQSIQEYWGYRQIHYRNEDCLLLSGSNGDETFLRGPLIGSMLQVQLGRSPLKSLYGAYQNSYASKYLMRPKVIRVLEDVERDKSLLARNYDDLAEDICVRLTFDYQHWHLGKTWTWTPFKDIEISRILLRLGDPQALAEQFFEGAIQKALIKKIAPECLALVQKFKNEPLDVTSVKEDLGSIMKDNQFLWSSGK